MQATARRPSVVSATSCARRRLIRDVRPTMKSFSRCLIAVLWVTVAFAAGSPQVERLMEAHKYQGDSFAEALYWLPETGPAFGKSIADHKDWVGFEPGRWRLVPEANKAAVFKDIGEAFDKLDSAQLERSWKRLADWQSIHSQLALFETAMDGHEAYFDVAYQDVALKPAFDWILSRRPKTFEGRLIGATFAAGELSSFRAHLIQHILNMADTDRYQCYSRIYGKIATHNATKGEQNGGGPPATRPASK